MCTRLAVERGLILYRRMDNSNSFFRARPEQIKALLTATLILLSVIFWPAVQWGTSVVIRRNRVHSDQVEAIVPLRWVAAQDNSRVQAWSFCLTMFCSTPRSSMEIRVEETMIGKKEDAWLKRTELILRERRYSRPLTRSISSPAGNVLCLESTSEIRRGIVDSACFASETGLIAGFDGVASDLDDFYRVLATARPVIKE